MANITAENTAAFIEYDGDWSDDSDGIRRATVSNSSLTLNFTGTALWAFGGPEMNPLTDSGIYVGGSWNEHLHDVDTVKLVFRETSNASAYMTFIFEGTGIEVEGLTAPFGDTFSVTLDGKDPITRTSKSPRAHHLSILHREDGLEYKTHNLTLIKQGDTGCISISDAQVFIPQPTTPNTSLSLGAKAGIAVGLLSIFGLFALAVLYIRHRRAHIGAVSEEGHNEPEPVLLAGSNDWDIPVGQNNEVREVSNMVPETRVDDAPRPGNLAT
ncbi:hypothetical protein FRC09_003184 [Ceratobasidium sp. 395]|nr:hypothetical protein FRC09_003184 [Ceratobasidium sp. 395]